MKNSYSVTLDDGREARVAVVSDRVARISFSPAGGTPVDSALNRYGFITEPAGGPGPVESRQTRTGLALETPRMRIRLDRKTGRLRVTALPTNRPILDQTGAEFPRGHEARALFRAAPGEDWLGFGDQTRKRLYHRGHQADCQVRNVASYLPAPFFMSTRGAGVLVNTTRRVVFDMCRTDPGIYAWIETRPVIDYYALAGRDFAELLDLYTGLTGRPKLPPEWSFGLWYLCRRQANDFEAVSDALNFRREGIPCDILGLEPGWMEKHYDASTGKQWSRERFPIPAYCFNGPHNFLDALKRMGFKLALWLCNEYDLSLEEERRLSGRRAGREEIAPGTGRETTEIDEHFATKRYADQVTVRGEAWFDHLKKFVDQGIDFFKQDGAYQVLEHPDRVWGNGMTDDEMHNLYPLLYARQMYEGFKAHTGRRPLVFTVSGWTGFQAWCGTWTGDTGGRLETLTAMLNTALLGHSWVTNDMEVTEPEGVHFGYLQPWSQINSWNYFRMPWLQGNALCEMHRYYSRLRARLLPYLYACARAACLTGYPMIVPLTLEFPRDRRCRDILHQYLLGPGLMVSIYRPRVYFPPGRWKDFWTGEVIAGGREREITPPADRGGGLFVRAGAIVPFGPVRQYREEKPLDEIELYLFPDRQPSVFELYEDDGVSFAYLEGACALTRITAVRVGERVRVEIGPARGEYAGLVRGRRWHLTVHAERRPSSVRAGGKPVPAGDLGWDASRRELAVRNLAAPVAVTVDFG